eukprot:m51a1_g14833 hypothetical protein (1026) ;mRNA; f:711350-715827
MAALVAPYRDSGHAALAVWVMHLAILVLSVLVLQRLAVATRTCYGCCFSFSFPELPTVPVNWTTGVPLRLTDGSNPLRLNAGGPMYAGCHVVSTYYRANGEWSDAWTSSSGAAMKGISVFYLDNASALWMRPLAPDESTLRTTMCTDGVAVLSIACPAERVRSCAYVKWSPGLPEESCYDLVAPDPITRTDPVCSAPPPSSSSSSSSVAASSSAAAGPLSSSQSSADPCGEQRGVCEAQFRQCAPAGSADAPTACACLKALVPCLTATAATAACAVDVEAVLAELRIPASLCQRKSAPNCYFQAFGDPHFVTWERPRRERHHHDVLLDLRYWRCGDLAYPLLYEGDNFSLAGAAAVVPGSWGTETWLTNLTLLVAGRPALAFWPGRAVDVGSLPAGFALSRVHWSGRRDPYMLQYTVTAPSGEFFTVEDLYQHWFPSWSRLHLELFGVCKGAGHVQVGVSGCHRGGSTLPIDWRRRAVAAAPAACAGLAGPYAVSCGVDVQTTSNVHVAEESALMASNVQMAVSYLAIFGAPVAAAAAAAALSTAAVAGIAAGASAAALAALAGAAAGVVALRRRRRGAEAGEPAEEQQEDEEGPRFSVDVLPTGGHCKTGSISGRAPPVVVTSLTPQPQWADLGAGAWTPPPGGRTPTRAVSRGPSPLPVPGGPACPRASLPPSRGPSPSPARSSLEMPRPQRPREAPQLAEDGGECQRPAACVSRGPSPAIRKSLEALESRIASRAATPPGRRSLEAPRRGPSPAPAGPGRTSVGPTPTPVLWPTPTVARCRSLELLGPQVSPPPRGPSPAGPIQLGRVPLGAGGGGPARRSLEMPAGARGPSSPASRPPQPSRGLSPKPLSRACSENGRGPCMAAREASPVVASGQAEGGAANAAGSSPVPRPPQPSRGLSPKLLSRTCSENGRVCVAAREASPVVASGQGEGGAAVARATGSPVPRSSMPVRGQSPTQQARAPGQPRPLERARTLRDLTENGSSAAGAAEGAPDKGAGLRRANTSRSYTVFLSRGHDNNGH